jgi:hypothetical protein
MFLLLLKSCSRFSSFRRGIGGAVIGVNPGMGKKFRCQGTNPAAASP